MSAAHLLRCRLPESVLAIWRLWRFALCQRKGRQRKRLGTTLGTAVLTNWRTACRELKLTIQTAFRCRAAGDTISPAYNIWSSGLFCNRSDVLELTAQTPAWPVTYWCCFWTITENVSFLRVLVYTVITHIRGTCDDALHKLMFYLLTYLLLEHEEDFA